MSDVLTVPNGDVRGLCRALARDVTAMWAQQPELEVAYLKKRWSRSDAWQSKDNPSIDSLV